MHWKDSTNFNEDQQELLSPLESVEMFHSSNARSEHFKRSVPSHCAGSIFSPAIYIAVDVWFIKHPLQSRLGLGLLETHRA